jgi:adenine-specific DNA methylase
VRTRRKTNAKDDIMADLAARAGVIAKRLLAARGLIYLNDLNPDECRDVLKAAWREAATDRFPEHDVAELHAEIDAMVESLIDFPQPEIPRSALN